MENQQNRLPNTLNAEEISNFTMIDDYKLCRLVPPYGSYGMIRRSFHNGKYYALKVFFNEPTKNQIVEIRASQKLQSENRHPNIVQLLDVLDPGICLRPDKPPIQKLVLVFQHIDSTTLFEYYSKQRFSEELARFFFGQLIDALEFMHSRGCAHRDINLHNIMIDQNMKLILIDFGLASSLKKSQNESFEEQIDDPMADDVFSAGIVLVSMVLGRPIFESASKGGSYGYNTDGQWKRIWKYIQHIKLQPSQLTSSPKISLELRDLLQRMLNPDRSKRLTIQQIRQHPWFMNTQSPDSQKFMKVFNQMQERLKLEGRRNADVEEGWEEFEENVPEVNLSKLPVLEEYEKPDKVVDYGFKELMARIQWILTIDPNLWRKVEVKGEGSEIRFLIKFWDDDRLYLEGEQPENKAQNGEDKEVGSMEVELFWTHDKKLALHFVLSEEVNPYTYHKIKSDILEIL